MTITSRIWIRSAAPEHLVAMREAMREDDRRELACLGLSAHRALWRSYRGSLWAQTAFVDGDIAAMFGLGGCALSGVGRPWLLTTGAVERIPVSFVKIAREMTQQMLGILPRIENHVHADYTKAVRFLETVGFSLERAEMLNGAPFRKFWMER